MNSAFPPPAMLASSDSLMEASGTRSKMFLLIVLMIAYLPTWIGLTAIPRVAQLFILKETFSLESIQSEAKTLLHPAVQRFSSSKFILGYPVQNQCYSVKPIKQQIRDRDRARKRVDALIKLRGVCLKSKERAMRISYTEKHRQSDNQTLIKELARCKNRCFLQKAKPPDSQAVDNFSGIPVCKNPRRNHKTISPLCVAPLVVQILTRQRP